MNVEFSVTELVPHTGKMSMLDNIVAYGDDWLSAEVNIHTGSMFADEHGVPAWIGMEYMAQAVAAFAGLQERRKGALPRIGFLLGSRKYACSTDYFPFGKTLILRVRLDMEAENGLNVFQCEIHGEGVEASASMNVYQPGDPDKFLKENI